MQKTIPEAGKIYRSSIEPELVIYVDEVHHISSEENEGDPATFFVDACDPADKDDMQAIGYDFTEDEWNDHGFTLYPINVLNHP